MGERAAAHEPPTADDLEMMRSLTREAIEAGALGVSTSRNLMHRTKAGELAPSLYSEEDELKALAQGLRDAGNGVYQIIPRIMGSASEEFRSEEHTSELQSLMRISYAVFCLKTKKTTTQTRAATNVSIIK